MISKNFGIFTLLLCLALVKQGFTDGIVYKMCVPHKYYNDCINILKDPSEAGIQMECVSGRDRIECLDLINQKKADVLAADPEDMYVAYHTKNQDYRVISEFRTKVEKDAEFRYEGVILVKKSAKIASLKDLQGLKSCHTGFGRNVGYKIPITKLKNLNLLKISLDPTISATERELKALSEFFTKSCLVGTYSPNQEINRLLKKKYSNLCALCEKPEQCNYPDKYSGYDGAIRCLDKGEGDVAFTKTSFIKKYFGLIANGPAAEGNPNDFEYLCEDGSRKSVNGPACSWAQRPWQGYISNSDTVREKTQLENLQKRLDKFFENGLLAENKKAAENLLIEPNLILHEKLGDIKPKEYLERAGYKDVIERDGSVTHKIKICVSTPIEGEKCDTLKRAAFSRDIRPEFDCIMEQDCIKAVKDKKCDAVIMNGKLNSQARANNLVPLIYESFGADDVYVAVADPSLTNEIIKKIALKFDKNDRRATLAARLLNKNRDLQTCDDLPEIGTDKISIVHAKTLKNFTNKKLLCLDLSLKPLTESATCNVEANLGNSVFVRNDITKMEKDSFIHAFTLLSSKFGHKGNLEDVFEIFGEFKKGQKNVLFNDNAEEFVTEPKYLNGVNEEMFKQFSCGI